VTDHPRDARARRYAARVLVDGRLIAVNAEHGKASTRKNHGCECEPCKAAARAANTLYRRERLASDADFRRRNSESSRRRRDRQRPESA
jgi:hypothetical protein